MAYTYDITTLIGQLRLMIGDTDIVPTTDAHFTDEELQYFLTLNSNNLNLAAADALEAWMAALTRELAAEKIGDYSYSRKTIENMNKLRDEFRAKDSEAPVTDWAEMDLEAIGEYPVEESE